MRNLKSYTLLWIFFLAILPNYLLSSEEIEYSFVPKKVYEKQIFPISFLSTIKPEEGISFGFVGKSPILKNAVVINNGNKTFYTFYFKTTKSPFEVPYVVINVAGKEIRLDSISIPVEKLPYRENFSGVIASGLKIKSSQASVYDENTNLIAIAIEAHDANLEDIYVPDALKDGIEKINRTGSRIEGTYYIVLPASQKELVFSYFDTIKNSFIDKRVSISIDDGSVAAQTDLNPKDDSFELLKKYVIAGFVILFLLLFMWKRDFLYLFVSVIASAFLLTFHTPLSKICIKAGSPLYIIPTYNSTISRYIDREITATELFKRAEYHKIEYRKGVIGWVKDEDICEN
jgi:hypothetical protein